MNIIKNDETGGVFKKMNRIKYFPFHLYNLL